jgi:ABC-2 type transport system ATP-binding protein
MSAPPAEPAAPGAPPLFEADGARVAVDGVVAIERLSCASTGDRALVVGDAGALFAVLTGVPLGVRAPSIATRSADPRWAPLAPERDPEAPPGEARVCAGALRLAGRDVGRGEHVGAIGAAPLDPPLPPAWTAVDHVGWSARLAGAGRRAAVELAAAALARVGLERARKRPLKTFVLAERRALVLAAAAVTSPPVLVLEAPLAGLDGAQADFVASAVAAVTDGRRAIVSATRVDPSTPEGALARGASWALLLSGGERVADGTPAELFAGARTYALSVRTNAGALREALRARGIELRGDPPRCTVALPEGATTREILAAAAEARAAVVEMVPLV